MPKRPTPQEQRAAAGIEERPRGPKDVTTAVVEAATRLISEQGPSVVSLRDVAREANVSYGLIYRYFGSKEEMLELVFKNISERAASRLAAAGNDAHSLFEEFWRGTSSAESFVRMLAWLLLERRDPSVFLRPSPAMAKLVETIAISQEEATDNTINSGAAPPASGHSFDPRLVAAASLLLTIGWRLFSPYLIPITDQSDRDPESIREELGQLVEFLMFGSTSSPSAPDLS